MLTGVLVWVDPPGLIQYPLLPLSHITYVLLEPYESVPPACQQTDPSWAVRVCFRKLAGTLVPS